MGWYSFKPYVSAGQKRINAAKTITKLQKQGQKLSPVTIDGNKIARTFWGKAWCDNLESYKDYEYRLPRGRSYLRNGSVIDLQITPGKIAALVNGSSLYKVQIDLQPVAANCWAGIQRECAGRIGSLIELLQGKLSSGVMGVITRPGGGLFPKPAEIKKTCSCPDWADMCKHVAAAMYGVGARLDHEPEMLFVLRQVDQLDLIPQAGDMSAVTKAPTGVKTIAGDELADVFGIELERADPPTPSSAAGPDLTSTRKARRTKTPNAMTNPTPADTRGDVKVRPSKMSRAGRAHAEKPARPDGTSPKPRRRRAIAR